MPRGTQIEHTESNLMLQTLQTYATTLAGHNNGKNYGVYVIAAVTDVLDTKA